MAIHSSVDGSRQFAALTLSGPCDFAAVRAAILGVARRREGQDGIPVLIDFRGTPFVPSSVEAIELADFIAQPDGLLDHRVALVAADEAQLRVVSVIAALCTLRGGEARSFREREAALGWLRGTSIPFTGPSPSAPHGSLG
ncbi:MAG TPA: hypothetical protein VFG37_16060 [Planctomycetota bacterium]|nr:hypothetical protein [Planctomycetota bacterium]